jgi:RNA polymerase sigma factor (sigma-70 family)
MRAAASRIPEEAEIKVCRDRRCEVRSIGPEERVTTERSVDSRPEKAGIYGTGGNVKPVMAAAAASTEAREDELVAGAQSGSAEAFEALFRRYRDRIAAYVRSSVRDEGRTEDLVQEIFFSAHSSLSSLENPSAFRTWLYQIARNACLDEARRRSRQEDLILGWEEFPPPDERIVIHNHGADRALSQKEELANLTQAMDGLPHSQHEALVLRELEGMSYDEIGRRMRLSRHAVESILFRARRGLRGQYSDIQTGRRCRRMQLLMAEIVEGMGDLRERRKLIRHMRDCSPCRREAARLGLAGLAVPSEERRGLERAFSRVASFMPVPAFFGRRASEAEQFSGATSFAAQAQGAALQLTAMGSDHVVSAIHKAAAVMAAVAVVGGSGVAIQKAGVTLPMTIPVFDSATGSTQQDRPGGDTPRLSRLPKHPKAAMGTGGAAPNVGAHQAPASGSPASPTSPPAAAPAATAPPSGPPAPATTGTSPTTPAGADSTPTNSETFTSGGAPPPTDPTANKDKTDPPGGSSPTPAEPTPPEAPPPAAPDPTPSPSPAPAPAPVITVPGP